jgi:hypothetical protein
MHECFCVYKISLIETLQRFNTTFQDTLHFVFHSEKILNYGSACT